MVSCRKRKRDDAETCKPETETFHRSAVKRHLLTEAYATVLTLREYTLRKLPSSSRLRRKKLKLLGRGETTTEAERKISYFLDSTLICSRNAVAVCQGKDATLEQWLSFSQNGDDSRVTISGVTPTAEHTQEELLLLLGKSGQQIMLNLLTEWSIFVAVDAGVGNYYQISELKLNEADVLNRCPRKNDGQERSQIDKSHAHTAKIMMHMFPRQFGLHNVFTSDVNYLETAQRFQDYTLRDEEISKLLKKAKNVSADGTPKLPKRLRGLAWTLVQRLQTLHSRCSYTELMKHYCPSELDPNGPTSRMTSGGAAYRESICQRFNGAIDSANRPDSEPPANAGNPSRDKSVQSESIVDLATSPSQVSSFCQAVLCRIIPNDFWGEGQIMEHNKAAILRQVDTFIRLRRFESISLHDIMQGLKIGNIPWLQPPELRGSQKACQSDTKKRHEIFHEVVYFVFDSLLMPLIKSNFYVTESSTHRNQIFYFRHDVWRRIAAPAISVLKRDMFEDVKLAQANNILDTRRLGHSAIRLLPKGSTLRPIMNLRRRQLRRGMGSRKLLGPSINSVLSPIYTALRFEKEVNPQILGSTLFSVNDMYTRLKGFKQAIGAGATKNKLYFAKLDVQAAFDTIPQERLLQLMRSVPSQSKYTIVKHAEVRPGESAPPVGPRKNAASSSRAVRRWRSSVLPPAQENADFTTRVQKNLAAKQRDTVFIDGVVQRSHDTGALLYLMTDHVTRNLVTFGKKYYRQKRGIPQGSVLSSFLCNYFYADLERTHLGFLSGSDCLLMRLTDDFLLITLDKSKAIKFVETMHGGLPDYGVRVSPHKTVVNFEMLLNGGEAVRRAESGAFPYCGTCIDDETLEITKDTQAGLSTAISNALTIECTRTPGQNFQRKILNAFKIQSHLMFFDTAHNAESTVLESLRYAFHETARKMVAYVRCLAKARRPRASLVIETICRVANVAYFILSSKSRRLRYPDYTCTIRRAQVTR
ncbi:hypothetical protein E4U16_007334 [Claviceps sp. LM84 group G4]|nr:hypothetical protein E4U16_007334 [Claviceps sp. LM84 group G4]